jgi:hypothetical protein
VNSILCLVDDSPWHNPSCLKRTRVQSGIEMLLIYPIEEDITCSQLMQWKCYELMLHGKTRSGKDNKVLQLQYKETKPMKFLQYLRPTLHKFIVHNYVARFQEEQYRICLDTFPVSFVMFVVEFVKKLHLSRIQWSTRNALAFLAINHLGAHMLLVEPKVSCWPWFR